MPGHGAPGVDTEMQDLYRPTVYGMVLKLCKSQSTTATFRLFRLASRKEGGLRDEEGHVKYETSKKMKNDKHCQSRMNHQFISHASLVTHIMLKIAFPASTWWILRKIKDVVLLLSFITSKLGIVLLFTHH